MKIVLELVQNTAIVLLMTIQLAMVVRAILSWFPLDNGFVDFVYTVTEPFLYPVRRLFEKMGWFQGLPIDISFMVSYLLLMAILLLLM